MKKEEILSKQKAQILDTNNRLYTFQFKKPPVRPVLDQLVLEYRDSKGQPFPQRDLEFHHVGFSNLDPITGLIDCYPISWAQISLISSEEWKSRIPKEELFNPMTVCCLVKTDDQKFILTFRSKKVSTYQSMWHVSAAGRLDLDVAQRTLSPEAQVYQEIEEELNILPDQVENMKQLGLSLYLTVTSSVEICFQATTKLSSGEVLKRAKSAKDSWEGKITAASLDEVRRLVSEETFTPGGAATIVLAGLCSG
jgi:hypothetical protein